MKHKIARFVITVLSIFVLTFSAMGTMPARADSSPPESTADEVYGKGGRFDTDSNIDAGSLYVPSHVIVDGSGGLYVADGNSRVLYYPAGSTIATRVYGQGGDFTTKTLNKGGVSADSMQVPFGLALDMDGNLYVADPFNNRILYYPAGSTTATRVYGQGGDFTSNTANKDGVSADSLSSPVGVSVDGDGNLYVADLSNNRVLYYPAGSTTAARVYGQGGDFTSNIENKGGINADSTSYPCATALDPSGNLYVADRGNNRILYYPAGSTTATRVYGQGGDFTTNIENKDGVSADSLSRSAAMALDSSGNLYIADSGNYRMLYYPAGSTTATQVYGQGGSFTSKVENKGGTSADSLRSPRGASVDSDGNLYVSDTHNNRVLYYPAGSTTATQVYGQGGNFDTQVDYSISAETLTRPEDVVLDGSGNLYVADGTNNRVLYYPAGSTTATRVYGQAGSFTTNIINKGGISADSLYWPHGLTLDMDGNLYVADSGNNRVLYYPAGSTTATRVYGQSGSFTTNTANKGGISANSLYEPNKLALDPDGILFVADTNNNRVLYYPAGSTTATRVYGQAGSFTTNTINKGGISANSLYNPGGVTLDVGGNLYVADYMNNRVLYYPDGSTTATRVYGQGGDFTSNTANMGGISADSLYKPGRVTLDTGGNLYAADSYNSRVLYYPNGSTTATWVYGQGGSFTSNTPNNGGISADSLNMPFGVFLDAGNGLYVADTLNNRVLKYLSPAAPTLGTYPNTNLGLSGNATINPSAAPTGATSINITTDTNFTGILTADPLTGVVRVTNALQAGTYTVTAKAFGAGGSTATATFPLTVDSGTACTGTLNFTNAADVGSLGFPMYLAVGDFNNDGVQDLAVENWGSDSVSIRLGNGAGGFSSMPDVGTGDGPRSVTVGDFNGDGRQDFAVPNYHSNTVSIRLGDGAGNFSNAPDVGTGSVPLDVAVGDYNGDGRQDLAIVNANGQVVSIRLGDGAGNFSNAADVGVGRGSGSIAMGDFNGDGVQDLAIANNNDDNTSIRLGQGDGTFTNAPDVENSGSLAVGDFDNDGAQDLAIGMDGGVFIRLGQGDGTFTNAPDANIGGDGTTVVGDFNNDGKQDIAMGDRYGNTVSIGLGDGAGNFSNAPAVSVGNGAYSIAVGDFNGDGVQDIAAANYDDSNVSIRLGGCLIISHTLTYAAGTGGSITAPTTSPTTHNTGAVVTITALPNVGYHFVNWTGDVSTVANVNAADTTITMNGDYNITANFAIDIHATITALASSLNPSTFGSPVTFTATVSPTPDGGTVAFKDNGTVIPGCEAKSLSGGQAACDTSALTAGAHVITAEYSGAPSYTASNGTLSPNQQVNQAAPILTWADPANIVYGTALSGTQLNATANVAGAFTYTPASGTVLNVGAHTLHVDFVPTDTVNYANASKDVSITVTKAATVITWADPAAIDQGTPLSAAQLNATANVPGTFTYTPPIGTYLSTGVRTLHVDFTPTDAVNYANASKQVSLTVNDHVLFNDVPVGYWARSFIERLALNQVTGGCGNGNFCPDLNITRDQMAVFILRAKHGPAYTPPAVGAGTGFNDVPTSHWAAAWIKQLVAEGITGGCGNNNFCPTQPVTRAQVAVFLLVAKHGAGYTPPAAAGLFNDVPVGNWAAPWAEQLVAEGIASGCGGGNFCPNRYVTRAQMAVFLVTAFKLP